jgi:transcriptional regulator with XRE-family HTH domain
MALDSKGFDSDGFYRAIGATASARKLTWKQVSAETGVSQSTLSRMASGRQPDAASLAALGAWAGLNPTDFVAGERRTAEPLALVTKLLREDPNLDSHGADALESIIKAAYEQFRNRPSD